jgi:hypothetical protein
MSRKNSRLQRKKSPRSPRTKTLPGEGNGCGRLVSRHETKRLGELAEIAFLHKASTLGFHVSKPYGDNEHYDFVVAWRSRLRRVQVKSTSTMLNGRYHVNSGRHLHQHVSPYSTEQVDFFAIYIRPEDTWYILPVSAIYPRVSLLFCSRLDTKRGVYDAYREAWDLMREE